MNFYKAAAAFVLVAMALTSCKGSQSDSSESAPPATETISMATACEEIEPLFTKIGDLMESASQGDGDDPSDEIKSNLDEIDSIAATIETEQGVAAVQEVTKSVDQLLDAISSGKDTEESIERIRDTAIAFADECKKSKLEN